MHSACEATSHLCSQFFVSQVSLHIHQSWPHLPALLFIVFHLSTLSLPSFVNVQRSELFVSTSLLALVLTKIFHTVLWYGRYLPMAAPFALVLFFKLINLFIHWFYISTTVSAPSYPTILPSPPFHRPSMPPPSPFRRHKASHGIEQRSSLQDILLFSQVFPLHHIHKHSLTKNLL